MDREGIQGDREDSQMGRHRGRVTAFVLAYTPYMLPGWLGNAMSSLLGFLGKIGASAFGAGLAGAIGIEVGATVGSIITMSMAGVGAVANHLQPKKGQQETPEQRRNRLIRRSINSALWRLRNMPGCKDFIQGNGKHDPIATLESLKASKKVIYDSSLGMSGPVGQVHGADVGKGPASTMRLGDKWFDDWSVGQWRGTMNRNNTRTNILLHELKHAVDKAHGIFEPNDRYYKDIAKKCFGVTP